MLPELFQIEGKGARPLDPCMHQPLGVGCPWRRAVISGRAAAFGREGGCALSAADRAGRCQKGCPSPRVDLIGTPSTHLPRLMYIKP